MLRATDSEKKALVVIAILVTLGLIVLGFL